MKNCIFYDVSFTCRDFQSMLHVKRLDLYMKNENILFEKELSLEMFSNKKITLHGGASVSYDCA